MIGRTKVSELSDLVDELRHLERWHQEYLEMLRNAKDEKDKSAYKRQIAWAETELKRVKQLIVDKKLGRGERKVKEKKPQR
jgi:hypothetical protein